MRKIVCNNEICHAITETGLVFSWGNDIHHKGTLGLGENIYQVNTPVMNKYLSNNKIFDISLSEDHCAAIDFNNSMYTWGVGAPRTPLINNIINFIPNKVIKNNNKAFLVDKVKCGKNYTCGITNAGNIFLFMDDDIIFFSFEKNFEYNNLNAKNIYCGENYILILLEKEKLLMYCFNEGLYEIIFDNINIHDNNCIFISKVNILDKNFYILDEKNRRLYEFVYQSKNYNDEFNIKNFYINDYKINNDVEISIIEMPFFVKFLFFWIKCSENQKNNFISQKNKIFISNKDKSHKSRKGPYINEFILFGSNKKKIELKKILYENSYKKNADIIKVIENKNIEYNAFEKNDNIDLSEQHLSIPISKNYGDKNDFKVNKNKNIFLDFEKIINSKNKSNTINNENDFNKIKNEKISRQFFSNQNRKKYSISLEKRRNNENLIESNTEEVPSFLTQNKTITNESDSNYLYNQITIRKNKRRSISQMRQDYSNKYNSKTINHDENEFDSILKCINNRKFKINHNLKIENKAPSTKKILSQIGRTKSKTEMLIKELHETFFGKNNNNNNKKNNIYNKYLNNNYIKNNKDDNQENKKQITKVNNEKKIFKYKNNKNEIKLFRDIINLDEEKILKENQDNEDKKENLIKEFNMDEKNKIEKIEEEKIYNMKKEKEKLKEEIKEIKAKKDQEYILKQKLEKECQEIEKNIIKKELLEKELKEKIENELQEKYKNENNRNNYKITSEIKKFIEGKNKDKNINNYKFIPEILKTENENDFVMKGINKKNYNFTISNNQQINIQNHLNKIKYNNELEKENKNILNTNNDFNLNIEDIISTRDIILENNNNNNISQKIDILDNDNKILSPIVPQTLNESKLLSKKDTNRDLINPEENNKSPDINNINKEKEESIEIIKEQLFEENINIDNTKNIKIIKKEKSQKHINEIIEEKQESLEDTNKSKARSKSMTLNLNVNKINNQKQETPKSLIPMAEISTSNMPHISAFDQNIISTIRKFEPKELEDITGSLRLFSNRSEKIIFNLNTKINNNSNNNKLISQRNNNLNISNNSSNLKPFIELGDGNKNINDDLNDLNLSKSNNNNSNIYNDNIKDQKMKIDELNQGKLLISNQNNNKIELKDSKIESIQPNKIIIINKKEELNNIITEINQDNSYYFSVEDQIIKIKNNKIIELNSGQNLILNSKRPNNIKSDALFNNRLNKIINKNLISNDSLNKYNTFSINQNLSKSNNIIRGIQIKNIIRNKSYNNKKQKKKTIGLIEQIKKEQYEKKIQNQNQIIYNTYNSKNKIFLTNNNISSKPYINLKPQKNSKNSIANIGYNNMIRYEPGMIPININMNMNIMHDENNNLNSKKNNINFKQRYKNDIINIKLNKNNNNKVSENDKEKEKENESFIILRKKYLNFLLKKYGNDNINDIKKGKNSKNDIDIDNNFLKKLINNEIPIENFNLNELNLNCSNDMKSFINESLENFKLQQLKEKMNKINDSNFLYLNTNNNDKSIDIKNNNNMNGFIRLDYDDEIKDKSNILEPIELDKSNFNLNFRKSFVESISGIKN